jgi:hypothetical protein
VRGRSGIFARRLFEVMKRRVLPLGFYAAAAAGIESGPTLRTSCSALLVENATDMEHHSGGHAEVVLVIVDSIRQACHQVLGLK